MGLPAEKKDDRPSRRDESEFPLMRKEFLKHYDVLARIQRRKEEAHKMRHEVGPEHLAREWLGSPWGRGRRFSLIMLLMRERRRRETAIDGLIECCLLAFSRSPPSHRHPRGFSFLT